MSPTELVIPAFSPEEYPVTAVAASAFRDGASFTDILILGNVLTEIGEYAFAECTAFAAITIPDSVTTIGRQAFSNSHFSEITFTGTKEQWKAITKGDTWDYYTRYYVVHCTDGDLTEEEAQK